MNNERREKQKDVEIEEQELYLADYPLDDILIRTSQLSIREIIEEIDDGLYILDPDFQRAFVWSPEQQSRLIESVLMRYPSAGVLFCGNKSRKNHHCGWIATHNHFPTLHE